MHHRLRRPTTVLLAVICTSMVLAGSQATPVQAPPADVLKAVQAKVAPDTTIAVFDVKAELKQGVLEVTGDVDRAESRDAALSALRSAGYGQILDKIAVLPDPSLGAQHYAIVSVSVATMKGRPSHSSELVNQLVMGMTVKVLKREGGWYYSQSLDDRYLGWMEPDHLSIVTREDMNKFLSAARVVVTVPFAMAFDGVHADSQPVCDLVLGNVLLADAQMDNGRRAVRLPDGRSGYVDSSAVMDYKEWKASRRLTPENIEKTARLFMGVPYIWGGTSPKGFDCSGFTKTVFRANGLELQRDADQQSEQGEAVTKDADLAGLRKGDLLFFGPRAGVTRITHVGIYLGDKLFIHCAGKVKLNSFDPKSPIYSENLLGRLVNVRRLTTK